MPDAKWGELTPGIERLGADVVSQALQLSVAALTIHGSGQLDSAVGRWIFDLPLDARLAEQ